MKSFNLFDRFADRLIARAKRTPYWHLGEDGSYMERYWLVPYKRASVDGDAQGCGPVSPWRRPLAWILQQFGIAVRVHVIKRPDNQRHFHDHPWHFASLVLRGWYIESRPGKFYNKHQARTAGSLAFRRASDWHRISSVPTNGGVTTLFITGPIAQRWGFLVDGKKILSTDYFRGV